MLTIRNEQILQFRRAKVEEFVDSMCAYLAEEFPNWYEGTGEKGVRDFVRRNIERAKEHRVETKGAVAIFIDLTLQYGDSFERMPERAWALKTLTHPTIPDHVRMEEIQDRAQARTGGMKLRMAKDEPFDGGANKSDSKD